MFIYHKYKYFFCPLIVLNCAAILAFDEWKIEEINLVAQMYKKYFVQIIFNHLKLLIILVKHNFKWVNIIS